ncbi:hypothetical protein [Nocardioides acrostichi]|uniref:Lipoprotein n=1 Tax=Nocardioides acrostichi TaxID=2784339 RepID=A0A930Y6S1_9ACTN|nr:hypothetical protein [Nocardioides acrostichi]MBF4161241.1 hypothetical protein [Nocardioides acrostichi]
MRPTTRARTTPAAAGVILAVTLGSACGTDSPDPQPAPTPTGATMTTAPAATNPLTTNLNAFTHAGLLFVLAGAEPGTNEVDLRGVIDVDGHAGVHRGDSVSLEWPYRIPQKSAHRDLVVPVELQLDGSYRATSAGLDQRSALRLLAGLPESDPTPTHGQIRTAFEQAPAVGSYAWSADPESDGRSVHATLQHAFKGDPPSEVELRAPDTDEPGGPWTFLDAAATGAQYGTVFFDDSTGSLRPSYSFLPWQVVDSDLTALGLVPMPE